MMAPKRYRILYIERPVFVGGSVLSLYELVRGLDTSRYEAVVLFHGPNPYSEQFRALGVKVIVLRERRQGSPSTSSPTERDIAASLSRYGSWLATGYREAKQVYLLARRDLPLARRLARLIEREAIDLVHCNNSKNRAALVAAQLVGVSHVCHVRMWHDLSLVDRTLARSVNSFIYISRAVERSYLEQGIPPGKGRVIHNPINTEAFGHKNPSTSPPSTGSGRWRRGHRHGPDLRVEFGCSDQDRLISNVGRLGWWKGHEFFLTAVAQVIQSQPDTKALIVGAPSLNPLSQAYYEKLQQLVADYALSDHVIFTGFREDIPRIMSASDIVVHSASEPEPFGRVIVEAMAAGRPVIATAAGGVLDIIEDQVNGLLVPPKNATLMAQAIERLFQDQELARDLGRRAQRHARERFSVEQHVAAIQNTYQSVLAAPRSV